MGKRNIGDEEIMGRYGAGTRNKEGSRVVDFAERINLVIVNTYFKKKDEHRVMYKSGNKSTQVDYVMCRRRNRRRYKGPLAWNKVPTSIKQIKSYSKFRTEFQKHLIST